MFDKMSEKYVKAAIGSETQNAIENYGLKYNSFHEGYAVLKEEVEEARDEHVQIDYAIERLWNNVKTNDVSELKNNVSAILLSAEKLALEAVQIAAVCNKILKSI